MSLRFLVLALGLTISVPAAAYQIYAPLIGASETEKTWFAKEGLRRGEQALVLSKGRAAPELVTLVQMARAGDRYAGSYLFSYELPSPYGSSNYLDYALRNVAAAHVHDKEEQQALRQARAMLNTHDPEVTGKLASVLELAEAGNPAARHGLFLLIEEVSRKDSKNHQIASQSDELGGFVRQVNNLDTLLRLQSQGNKWASILLTNRNFSDDAVQQAEEYGRWTRLAAQGNGVAALQAGNQMSWEGDSHGMSYYRMQEARKWFQIAAEQGLAEGFRGVADTYEAMYSRQGEAPLTSQEEAQQQKVQMGHYLTAAKKGSLKAQLVISQYLLAQNDKRSWADGIAWATKVANKIDLDTINPRADQDQPALAAYVLGEAYLAGIKTAQDLSAGRFWMQLAANKCVRQAQTRMVTINEQGIGQDVNLKEAATLAHFLSFTAFDLGEKQTFSADFNRFIAMLPDAERRSLLGALDKQVASGHVTAGPCRSDVSRFQAASR